MSCRTAIASMLVIVGIPALGGCAPTWTARESVSDLHPASVSDGRMQLKVQPCVDRTGYATRELGREATDALVNKLAALPEFELKADGRYVLACDISVFAEGSAFKRWLMPGWGTTASQIAMMVTDSRTGETIAIIRGRATVAAGGLYSVGAEQTILSSALDDVIKQLRQVAGSATSNR